MVMLSERARQAIEGTQSSSFACDLKKWMQIAEGYEKGQHAYHTTMPTDALVRLRDVMAETRAYGFEKVRQEQIDLRLQGARPAGVARLSQRGGRRLQGARRGRELHQRPGHPERQEVPRRGAPDGFRRALAVR